MGHEIYIDIKESTLKGSGEPVWYLKGAAVENDHVEDWMIELTFTHEGSEDSWSKLLFPPLMDAAIRPDKLVKDMLRYLRRKR